MGETRSEEGEIPVLKPDRLVFFPRTQPRPAQIPDEILRSLPTEETHLLDPFNRRRAMNLTIASRLIAFGKIKGCAGFERRDELATFVQFLIATEGVHHD